MSNPYSSPNQPDRAPNVSAHIDAPAIALIVVSSIAIAIGLLSLAGDIFFLVSGLVDDLEAINQGPISERTQIIFRMIWGIVLIVASCFVLFGSIKMKQRKSFATAKAASIVALIPLIGPCCILGIPFGIWALIALGKPGVRQSFS